jgi:transposase
VPGKQTITSWDIEELFFLGERYGGDIANIAQLRGGIAERTAYAHFERWRKLGLAYAHKYQRGKPPYITLTKKAYELTELPYTAREQSPVTFPHRVATNHVEHFIRTRFTVPAWKTERRIRYERGLRDYYEYWRETIHIADSEAYIIDHENGWEGIVAIEVERTRKAMSRLDFIVSSLAGDYDHIWYFAAKNTYEAVAHAIEQLPPRDVPKFALWKLEQALSPERKTQPLSL